MYLDNLNFYSFLLFLILVSLFFLFSYFFYKRNKKDLGIIFLFVSFLFLLFNIFYPKLSNNSSQKVDYTNILFILDVSKSMNAIDIETDNKYISRLEFSKKIISDYISLYPNNNYALEIFSWENLEILPFNNDISLFKTILSWISSYNVSKYWTDIVSAISNGYNFFKDDYSSWLIVVFTDWGDEIDETNLPSKSWVNKLIVWLWSPKWAFIPESKDILWNTIYKKYNWQNVLTKLNKKSIKEISKNVWWDYIYLDRESDFPDFKEKLNKNNNYISSRDNSIYDYSLVRFFSFLSFISFCLFIFFSFRLWKKY